MATMILRDMVICKECGAKMFPCFFDKEKRMIGYRCSSEVCGVEQEYSFDAVKLSEGERVHYLSLNDEGEATWKCYEHGYCEFPIDTLFDKDFTKFERCCCILGKDIDEIEDELEYAETVGREKIEKLVEIIGEDRIADFADDLLYDTPADLFDGDYVEALIGQASCNGEDIDDFIYSLIVRANEMYEIEIDDDCNLIETE